MSEISNSTVGTLSWRWWWLWLVIKTGLIINNLLNHNRTGITLPFNFNIAVCVLIILCSFSWICNRHRHSFPKSWKPRHTWIKRLSSLRYGLSILFLSFLLFNTLFLLFKSVWWFDSSYIWRTTELWVTILNCILASKSLSWRFLLNQ